MDLNVNERKEIINKPNIYNKNSIQARGNISQEELIKYSSQKIIKDVEFSKNTIPYIRSYIYMVGFGILIGNYIWKKYYKNNKISFTQTILLNLADLEEKKTIKQ